MVGAKASNRKRLRTESDEATIKSPSFIWRAIVFPGALHEKRERHRKWKGDSRRSMEKRPAPNRWFIRN